MVRLLQHLTNQSNLSIELPKDDQYHWKVHGFQPTEVAQQLQIEVIYFCGQRKDTVDYHCEKRYNSRSQSKKKINETKTNKQRQQILEVKRSDYLPFVKIVPREECEKLGICFEEK